MIHHVWTVVCSRAVIDRDSNNVSLQNVVEQLTISREPGPVAIPVSLDIMTLWARADPDVPTKGRARTTFLSPSGVVNDGPFEYDIDLSKHRRYRSRGHIQPLRVEEAGRHTFRVELQKEGETEWRQVASIPLEINFVIPEGTEQAE
jgi:hypothetical protein